MKVASAFSALLLFGFAKADFNIYLTTCVAGFGSEPIVTTEQIVTATHDPQCNGCGMGRNPCNCAQAWEMRDGRDRDTYEIWEGSRNIGWCRPEGGPEVACNAWNWSCWKSKTHICYTANCGPHRRSLKDRGQLDVDNWTPTNFTDAGRIVTNEEFLEVQKALLPGWETLPEKIKTAKASDSD